MLNKNIKQDILKYKLSKLLVTSYYRVAEVTPLIVVLYLILLISITFIVYLCIILFIRSHGLFIFFNGLLNHLTVISYHIKLIILFCRYLLLLFNNYMTKYKLQRLWNNKITLVSNN